MGKLSVSVIMCDNIVLGFMYHWMVMQQVMILSPRYGGALANEFQLLALSVCVKDTETHLQTSIVIIHSILYKFTVIRLPRHMVQQYPLVNRNTKQNRITSKHTKGKLNYSYPFFQTEW